MSSIKEIIPKGNVLPPQGGSSIVAKFGGIIRNIGMWLGQMLDDLFEIGK